MDRDVVVVIVDVIDVVIVAVVRDDLPTTQLVMEKASTDARVRTNIATKTTFHNIDAFIVVLILLLILLYTNSCKEVHYTT
jgi:hypothetical protein